MAKYLMLWELDQSRIPTDPKERGDTWLLLQAAIRQDFDKGLLKDWGVFGGNNKGYGVFEGTEVELGLFMQRYIPYAIFESHHISSLDTVTEWTKALAAQ